MLSSLQYARRIPGWRRAGFSITLYFLQAASADFAVARVAQRVAPGGHSILEVDIRRRHARGLVLFPTYRALAECVVPFQGRSRSLALTRAPLVS